MDAAEDASAAADAAEAYLQSQEDVIMQNDEDVSSKPVQDKIKAAFRECARTCLKDDDVRYPNLLSISEDMGYKELALVSEVIPNLSEEGLERLEADFLNFLEAINARAHQADTTWQQVLKYFDFLPEMRKIEQSVGIRGVSGVLLDSSMGTGRATDPNNLNASEAPSSISDEHKR